MWIGLTLLGMVVSIALAGIIFVNVAPQIGQRPEGKDLERISKSPHYSQNKFVNLTLTTTGDIVEALQKMPDMMSSTGKVPEAPLPVVFSKTDDYADSIAYITWYGHSAFLIETAGMRILLDPMLGDMASPLPFGSKRFAYQAPIPVDKLTDIDVVVISHDHYDHLDYPTVVALKDEVKQFVTPLGIGSHLKRWGVEESAITELDWWQSTTVKNVELTACPSRHFSGRGLTDRDATLWAGWVIATEAHKMYFSGDSGYGDHFREIGKRYGAFDLAMIECGQYNEAWSNIHMMPEESVQAGLDLGARLAMPIHWGAFRLAPHHWTDPVERFQRKAQAEKLPYILPQIGERFRLGVDLPQNSWWQNVK